MAEITLTEQNFEQEVLKSDLPVLADFWATWCGPCRMLAPTVAAIAEKYDGRLTVGKVNVDDQPGLAGAFRIESIPTLILFKGGRAVSAQVGALPEETLCAWLEQEIG